MWVFLWQCAGEEGFGVMGVASNKETGAQPPPATTPLGFRSLALPHWSPLSLQLTQKAQPLSLTGAVSYSPCIYSDTDQSTERREMYVVAAFKQSLLSAFCVPGTVLGECV